MRRLAAVAVLAAALVAGFAAAGGPAGEPPTFRPEADAHVAAALPRRNFGRSTVLVLQARPAARAYLRFRVNGLAGALESATLRVHAARASRTGFAVRRTATSWGEHSITYARAPRALERAAASSGPLRRGWNEVDVTPLVRGAGAVALVLATSSRAPIELASSEARGRAPQLVVRVAARAPETLVAAGDIATCDRTGDEATAALVDAIPGTVATLGDNVYPRGTPAEFTECYDPSWGRAKARTRPSPGNHDYDTPGAAGYFGYFGAAAGEPGKGYYSYDLGEWHVVALNSNCADAGGCGAGSAQEQWLRADLAAHPAECTLAYWHHPRFSSGVEHPSDPAYDAFWRALYERGADVVLVGHEHHYERFAPQSPDARADPERGIRQFVVGTGGRSRYPFGPPIANSEVRDSTSFGVLELTLGSGSYSWEFVPVAGATFTDAGSTDCHS